MIEKALHEAKCILVLWSEQSVQSRYVRDEATYALERNKLVPVAIENVTLPFRFSGVQTSSLLHWNGSRDSSQFRKLVEDISAILRPSTTAADKEQQRRRKTEGSREVEEERFDEEEKQRSWEGAGRLEAGVANIQVVPLDFRGDVNRARAGASKGWLRLLADEVKGQPFQWEGLKLVARAQLDLHDFEGARQKVVCRRSAVYPMG